MEDVKVWITIIIAFLTFCLGTLFPIIGSKTKNYKEKKALQQKRNETINSIPAHFARMEAKQVEVEENLRSEIQDLKETQEKSDKRFDIYETQDLKYKIVDAFYSAKSIQEVPYEVLLIASECCDIYKSKGLNHEVGAKCDIIYEEIERRQRLKAEGKK